jgi:hypothetical protein
MTKTEDFPPQPVSFSQKLTTYHRWYDYTQWQEEEVGHEYSGTYVPFSERSTLPGLLDPRSITDELRQHIVDTAVTSAHANVSMNDLLALATMAEAGKTCDFLVNTLGRAVRIGRAARRLELRKLRREIRFKEFKERYMECRYAIRPLIYDVNGVVKALKTHRTSNRQTFRGRESSTSSNEDTVIGAVYFPGVAVDVNRISTVEITARAGVLCQVDSSMLASFGGDRLAETAWELIPFSFIIDWFANVGKTIGAWAPKAGVSQLASWVAVREIATMTNDVVNCRSTFWDQPSQASNSASTGAAQYGKKITYLHRYPSPALRTWPQFDVNLNLYKLTDLGIILGKIFR